MSEAMMTCVEFKKMIGECRSEMEVRRTFHYVWPHTVGTHQDLYEAMAFADARAEELAEAEFVTRPRHERMAA